ncbi:hypothetical protein TWF970_003491 [Orbilia oligospora]|uniref:PH domain-containing protein n=1 Tax=Orbilia oligospora TaxID=2813651 RepID=A0A7C8VYV8_ORBOL|nr:hypothetical protein TWF970_003491 [Orbilia oligospora]
MADSDDDSQSFFIYGPSVAPCNPGTPPSNNSENASFPLGPVPKGWLNAHKQSWYTRHITGYYSRKEAGMVAEDNVSRKRRLTSLGFGTKPDLTPLAAEGMALNGESSRMGASMGACLGSVVDPGESPLSPGTASHDLGLDIPIVRRRSSIPPGSSGNLSGDSFHTASESLTSPKASPSSEESNEQSPNGGPSNELDFSKRAIPEALAVKSDLSQLSTMKSTDTSQELDSTANLGRKEPNSAAKPIKSALKHSKSTPLSAQVAIAEPSPPPKKTRDKVSTGLVRFQTNDDVLSRDQELQRKLAHASRRRSIPKGRSLRKSREGEIVKMATMLVRVETTLADLSPDFDENEMSHIETRTIEKWREFVVVCRQTGEDDAPLTLKIHKSRTIPAIERKRIAKHSTREIPLNPRETHVNLFSSLDKTLCLWLPFKRGTIIFLMRPRAAASSVEWHTFLRKALGWNRPENLIVHVPDLSMNLRIIDPFDDTPKKNVDDEAISQEIRKNKDDGTVSKYIMRTSLQLLSQNKEWEEIIRLWKQNDRLGLAWRRYDRLEWVHGMNEKKMYGSMAMQKTHELELRPKIHYPTSIVSENGSTVLEPPPVEGFLLRLTSGMGKEQRKLFYKRLYFFTHDNLLYFCKPARALPPPPPKLPPKQGDKVPDSDHIIETIPLIYAVSPYSIEDGEVGWMRTGNAAFQEHKDEDAYNEAERKVNSVLRADGFVDLMKIDHVRPFGAENLPQTVPAGEDADFHQDVPDSDRPDGQVKALDDARTFEIVLTSGLIIRLQTFDLETRNEWMHRLADLIIYWKKRRGADVAMLKETRHENLDLLRIDEEMEAFIGQYGKKWEVQNSRSSPLIWNVCGISSCRTLTYSGHLYQKKTRHATFQKYHVVACHGKLLIFENTVRKYTGEPLDYVHQLKRQEISLRDAYVYSGIATESQLLYQNQTFDSNNPGRHALPRVYEDGWMSTDEDVMTCFVVWHGAKHTSIRSKDDGGKRARVKRVTALGSTGKSMVFKARSRQERDLWVMAIGVEIERLHTTDEIIVKAAK